ncbi:MAG: phenylalanine--tRNA ligase subunit beta, partial [Candidatus Binatia bacterium]
ALAGVMGGLNSEVTGQSKRIFLESAHFDPIAVRRTAKRLGLHSEASHRFERAVDPAGTITVADRAAGLIAEFAGGTVVPEALDEYPNPIAAPSILLRQERIEKLLGIKLSQQEIERLLTALGLKIKKPTNKDSLKVIPPTSRPDLTREADLIEEVARLYGYQNIPVSLPMLRFTGGRRDYRLGMERKIRSYLAGEGFVEVVNLPFTSERMNRAFTGVWSDIPAAVPVLNPLVQEQAQMRLSLIPGLVDNLRVNMAQKTESFFAYHLGKTFRLKANGETEEKQCLAGLLYGRRARCGLKSLEEGGTVGFLDGKGLVEGIFDVFRMREALAWERSKLPVLHPGRAAELSYDGIKRGYLGEIHPNFKEEHSQPTFVLFELDFEEWVQYSPRQITACSLPRYPAVERDFALVVDQAFSSQRIIDWIKDLDQSLIERVEVFDEYRGPSIPEGKKSLAYKASYRADDRTLTDGEVNSLHQELIDRMGKVFDAQRRS